MQLLYKPKLPFCLWGKLQRVGSVSRNQLLKETNASEELNILKQHSSPQELNYVNSISGPKGRNTHLNTSRLVHWATQLIFEGPNAEPSPRQSINDHFSDPLPQPWSSVTWLNVSDSSPQTASFCSHKHNVCKDPVSMVFLAGGDFEEKSAGNQVITILLFSSNSVTLCSGDSSPPWDCPAPKEILKQHCLLPAIHTDPFQHPDRLRFLVSLWNLQGLSIQYPMEWRDSPFF